MRLIRRHEMKKLEVKNVTYNKRLSEETMCYTATIYIDGEKMGTASNRGNGGSDEYSNLKLQLAMTPDMEAQLDEALDKWLYQRSLQQHMKTKTLFRLKGDPVDNWRTVIAEFCPGVKHYLERSYGDRLEAILNEKS
jgi:hypothetical protein